MFSSRFPRHLQQVSALAKVAQGSPTTSMSSRLCPLVKLVPNSIRCISCTSSHVLFSVTTSSQPSLPSYHFPCVSNQTTRRASTLSLGLNDHFLNTNRHTQSHPKHVQLLWREQRRHAGHSKWANIKHIKAGKDAAKASLTLRLTKTIRIAIREGGSADPKSNIQLARVLEQANQADVPKATVEKTIKEVVKGNESGTVVFFDAKIPGSFMMIIETFTSSPKKTKMHIQTVFKKLAGQLNDKISTHFFDYKGVVIVPPGGDLPNFEAAEEAAIMAEAEEVEETLDDEGNQVYQFICDPKSMHGVKSALVDQYPNLDIHEASFRYLPKVFTTLNEPALEGARKVLDSLEAIEEVVRVYTNIKAEGEA